MKRFLVPLLLVLSVLLNVLQFFRSGSGGTDSTPPGRKEPGYESGISASAGPSPGHPEAPKESGVPAPAGTDATRSSGAGGATEAVLGAVNEDELIYGPDFSFTRPPEIHGETPPAVNQSRLKAAALEPPSKAEAFSIHAVVHLPGDRVIDLGETRAAPGQQMLLQKVREFPFPVGIGLAETDKSAGSQAMRPVTPAEFENAIVGIDLELDVTPAPGALVVGGKLRHRTFQAFGRMPGMLFSPIATEGADESGKKVEVILTENRIIQPQFMITESQVLAAATDGQPIRIPVKMLFGQSILELTCRSVPDP